jgi:hypothetical protein
MNDIYRGIPNPKIWANTVFVDKTKEFYMLGGTNMSDTFSENIKFDQIRGQFDQSIWSFNLTS